MAKTGHFFYGFLKLFIDSYDPNSKLWGSTSRQHIGDLVMNFFLLWGPPFMTGDGPKMAGLPTFQSGPKGTKMVNGF